MDGNVIKNNQKGTGTTRTIEIRIGGATGQNNDRQRYAARACYVKEPIKMQMAACNGKINASKRFAISRSRKITVR